MFCSDLHQNQAYYDEDNYGHYAEMDTETNTQRSGKFTMASEYQLSRNNRKMQLIHRKLYEVMVSIKQQVSGFCF